MNNSTTSGVHLLTNNSLRIQKQLTTDEGLSIFWPVVDHPFGYEALIFLHIVTMLISIPGNCLTALIIIRKTSLRDEPAYLLICSVSCADFMVSIIAQPFNIYALAARTRISGTSEVLLYFTIWGFCGASAFGVVFITVDRFICITYPMHYTTLLNKQRTFYLIATQWVCGIAFGSLPLINLKQSIFPTATASLITILGMTVTMFYIYTEVYKNIRRLRKDQAKTSKEKQHNATLTIALIVLAFFVCWFPYIVTNFIISKEHPQPGSPVYALYYWFLGLGCWNSALNVIIYGLKNGTLRREACKLLRIRSNKTAIQTHDDSHHSVSVPSTSTKPTIICGLERANITLFCIPMPHNKINQQQIGVETAKSITNVPNNMLSDIPEESSKNYDKIDLNNNIKKSRGKQPLRIHPLNHKLKLKPGTLETNKFVINGGSQTGGRTRSLSTLFQAGRSNGESSNQRNYSTTDSELSDTT
ncbi:melanocyte-stimulating hormone receptor-like [Clytia hemisphaerica]|uniref:melanocyte-stimulating hormone receptor-like n=1 Tax=Clytia hemisphaerica TaxID=252671 RepID=UPI0034D4B164